jgi:hypothetical protein
LVWRFFWGPIGSADGKWMFEDLVRTMRKIPGTFRPGKLNKVLQMDEQDY